MTVIHAGETRLGQETKPDWCQMPSGGFFRMPKDGGEHDCHYHEYNELYLVSRGKAKILNAGKVCYVQARDIVCIKAGDEHDILEVYGDEDFELFWRTALHDGVIAGLEHVAPVVDGDGTGVPRHGVVAALAALVGEVEIAPLGVARDPLAALGDRLVGQADDVEGGQPGRDLHLHVDRAGLDPLKGYRRNPRNHACPS